MKNLHIISFDIPYPANYGGVIDVFYKLKAMSEAGAGIILHCFEYGGRGASKELETLCSKVYYYKRKTFINPLTGRLPYIVSTRSNEQLLRNLLKDEHPVLFEGLHSTFFIDHPSLKSRTKIVRMHNIEHQYYAKLEEVEGSVFKKYFFSREAARLKEYEAVLQHADLILAISPNDENYLKSKYENVIYLPAFHANEAVSSESGKGNFAFYHGKLSVGENDEAARFLVKEVFSQSTFPLIVAGNDPTPELKKAIKANKRIQLLDKASTGEIERLTRTAQLNVLPTFQATGIKLKLLNALYQGRFVLVNRMMVDHTGLEDLCHIADSPQEFIRKTELLSGMEFGPSEIERRKEVLGIFDVKRNAQRLLLRL